MSPRLAKFGMDKWLNRMQIIDAGPMAELWTLIHDFGNAMFKRQRDPKFNNDLKFTTWPTRHMKNLLGRTKLYRVPDGKEILNGTRGLQRAPVTQAYYPGKNTIVHHKTMGDLTNAYNKTTLAQMEILESLDYE
ncbi:MAG: hypothetical protein EBX03_12785 [Rhodobacteraceae bacterium]|nr:hypothetical protein [Paracoccaceae bacterium]